MDKEHLFWKFDEEKVQGHSGLIGIDEAGRGALAGPMVLAGVHLPKDFFVSRSLFNETLEFRDSKKITPAKRNILFDKLHQWKESKMIDFVIDTSPVEEIEAVNIVGAVKCAMDRVLSAFEKKLDRCVLRESKVIDMPLFDMPNVNQSIRVLMDGLTLKGTKYYNEGIVKGDDKSLSIAMASILAKVTRDSLLEELGKLHASYLFDVHKGYGTSKHREAIISLGPVEGVHRPSYLKKILHKELV